MVELRDQMAETTKQINAMTGEYVAMKESAHHYDSLITSLQQENDRVRGLLEELVQDKKNKEKQMDQVEAEVEKRIGQMTDILEFKVSFVLSRKKCRLHGSYKWIIMLEKCGRPDINVFLIKWIIGNHGNFKNRK